MTSVLFATLFQRCPACGKGKLFRGLLAVRDQCASCHISFREYEKGDGPAFFSIILVGGIVTALAGLVEYFYEPPYWLHALLWPPLIVVLSLWSLRLFKALIIAAQYKHIGLR